MLPVELFGLDVTTGSLVVEVVSSWSLEVELSAFEASEDDSSRTLVVINLPVALMLSVVKMAPVIVSKRRVDVSATGSEKV